MNKIIILILIGLFIPLVLYGQSWEELINNANKFQKLGDYDGAILSAESAKQKAFEEFGPDHKNYILTLNKLALLYKSIEKNEPALILYWEAKNTLKQSVGIKHPDYVSTLNNLAELYNKTGNNLAALTLYKEASDIISQEIGVKNSIYATLLSN